MRHLKDGRKFGRNASHRKAMFRNLAANLILHEKIVTTDVKAKELRRIADRLITVAKGAQGTLRKDPAKLSREDRELRLRAYRQLRSFLPYDAFDEKGMGTDLVGKLMDEIAPRYVDRNGGYTRIMKLGNRKGDNALMSAIEWLPAAEGASTTDAGAPESMGKRVSKFFRRSKKEASHV